MKIKEVILVIVLLVFLSSIYGCAKEETFTPENVTEFEDIPPEPQPDLQPGELVAGIPVEEQPPESDPTLEEPTDDMTLFQTQPDYCEQDSDCVPKECCHPETCVNSYHIDSCEGNQMCTTDCRPCVSCTCEDNQCNTKTIEGCC